MQFDDLIDQICDEIRGSKAKPDVLGTVTGVLIRAGLDLRREPSLEEMKQILVQATRAANERSCIAC